MGKIQLDAMAASLSDSERYADLDVAFHLELARATQNPLFVLMLESVATMLQQSRGKTLALAPVAIAKIAQRAHERIFSAVEARDSEAAAAAMKAHLELQRQDFEMLYAKESGLP